MDGQDASLLVIIIDVNRVWWGEKVDHSSLSNGAEAGAQQNGYLESQYTQNGATSNTGQQITLTEFIDSIITFSNAHLLTSHKNKLAIIASHACRSQYIYPPPSTSVSAENLAGATADTLQLVKNAVKGQLSHLLSEVDDRDLSAESVTAGALCMALCHIHKKEQELSHGEKLQSRVLIQEIQGLVSGLFHLNVVKGVDDNSDQYMNFMNSVFTAQKKNVVIDACLFHHDSGLLQQACDITNGIYLRIPHMKGLLQYLLWTYLPDQLTRSKMSMPPRSQVDYRAACFCHRQLIDRGYVCSVCLSIFCDFQAICSTCRVPFKIPGGPMIKKKRKLPT